MWAAQMMDACRGACHWKARMGRRGWRIYWRDTRLEAGRFVHHEDYRVTGQTTDAGVEDKQAMSLSSYKQPPGHWYGIIDVKLGK
jgi:hypothetical protein